MQRAICNIQPIGSESGHSGFSTARICTRHRWQHRWQQRAKPRWGVNRGIEPMHTVRSLAQRVCLTVLPFGEDETEQCAVPVLRLLQHVLFCDLLRLSHSSMLCCTVLQRVRGPRFRRTIRWVHGSIASRSDAHLHCPHERASLVVNQNRGLRHRAHTTPRIVRTIEWCQ